MSSRWRRDLDQRHPARLFAGAIVELLAVVLAGRIECLCRGPRPDLRQIKTCEAA
jgi:hypothetical protein